MSNAMTAPGQSVLWTEVALRALTGSAWTETPWDDTNDKPCPMEPTIVGAVVSDAMAIADAFEAACIARHEAEQVAERERHNSWIAEATTKVLATKHYRFRAYTGDPVLTVDRVVGVSVLFLPDANVGHGAPVFASLADVAGENGFEPVGAESTNKEQA